MSEEDDDIVAALRRGEGCWEYAAADEIEALRDEIDALCIVNARLTKEAMSDYHEGWEEGCAAMKEENALLHQAMHDIYEVYAGSEGFHPETCAEAYLQDRIKEMAYIAGKHKRAAMGETE